MKIIISSVAILVIALGGGVVYRHEKQLAVHQEMVKIVKENKSVIEEYVRLKDDNHKIQRVVIDYQSIQHSPMGGISLTGYVNNDPSNDFSVILAMNKGHVAIQSGQLPEVSEQ
ncbi:hypothetical protein FC69_GL000810 [Latilactobacillus fuchuensis DSM 14340 = JCM 11249]|uniref:DUF1433 domain-containing protein n=2 Tax=Latilactobacillus fuchuensis TaxID=164393 RepID=A0A0R1RWK1_9LACO|nr:hypothetical protein FC69_GL000810 [Latilactobacillus fuchuensis DSM 14340 = JCM 11249]